MPQLPSLERWALLPFWGFPTLTCLPVLFSWTCYFIGSLSYFSRSKCWDFIWVFFFILSLFFCTIFWVSLKGQLFKASTSTYDLQMILVQDFVPIRTALRGGGIASSSFILFFYLLYWYYSSIVYFVCAPASEFGAMGSTSFSRFSYPNLLLAFLKILSEKLRFLYKILFP